MESAPRPPDSVERPIHNDPQSASETHPAPQSPDEPRRPLIAVVVPCYRVREQLADVLQQMPANVWRIYCVDDACPERSGEIADKIAHTDPRIRLIVHEENQGVGGAVTTGYRHAVDDGADVIVKVDGDGQMDPVEVETIAAPILRGEADYVKGNRFYRLEGLREMPVVRLIGNAGLSFFSKLSTGYWNLFDPTNGYTAIHARVAAELPLHKLSRRYFFESDILFRLNMLRAVIVEVPMSARYAEETSSLNPWRSLVTFPAYHLRNFAKRIFYNYFLRDFSIASVNLVLGSIALTFGVCFGAIHWVLSAKAEQFASAGTVMLAALPIIVGVQMLLSFISYDIANIPRTPIHPRLRRT